MSYLMTAAYLISKYHVINAESDTSDVSTFRLLSMQSLHSQNKPTANSSKEHQESAQELSPTNYNNN